MRPTLRFAATLLVALVSPTLAAQTWQSVAAIGGAGSEGAGGLALDAAGNAYLSGTFTGSVTLGGTTLTSAGAQDVVVAKVDPAGAVVWALRVGGTGFDFAGDVTLDAAGNVYASGAFRRDADFGSITLTADAAGFTDAFLMKLSPTGTVLWASRAGGPIGDGASGIVTGSAGAVYLAGTFAETADFGTAALTSAGGTDVFVAALDAATGAFMWAERAGGTGFDSGTVAAGPSGDLYVTGAFQETVAFGTTTLTSGGGSDAYVARFAPSTRAFAWATRVGGPSDAFSSQTTLLPSGDAVVAGFFNGTADFGTTMLTSAGDRDLFVMRVGAADGAIGWAQRGGGPGFDYGLAIAPLAGGDVAVSGVFSETAVFGGTTLSSPGGGNLFLLRLASDGAPRWAVQTTNTGGATGNALAASGPEALVVAGVFQATSNFGPLSVTSVGGRDLFVARLNAMGVAAEADPSREAGVALAAAPSPAASGHTVVSLTAGTAGLVTADLFDALGRHVATLHAGPVGAGATIRLAVPALAPGVYVVRALGADSVASRAFTVMR